MGLGFGMKLRERKREAAAGSNRLVFGFRVRVPFVVHILNLKTFFDTKLENLNREKVCLEI